MRITARTQQWLADRGLNVNLAAELGWSTEETPGGEVLKIPYVLNGEVVNHKYRHIDRKRFYQDAEAVKSLWNGDVLLRDPTPDTVVICEGEMDALAILGTGLLEAVVSVPDGAPAQAGGTGSKYSFLEPYKEALKRVSRVILAVDGDGPGRNLLKDLSERIGAGKCWWIDWPRGIKDANELLLEHGEDAVRRLLMLTKPCEIEDVFLMSQIPDLPDPEVYSTGIRALDPHWKMVNGFMTVITGIPSSGKTTLVHDVCCRVADAGKRVAVSSFEQHPARHHKRAFRQWYCRDYVDLIEDNQLLAEADAWIDERFVFCFPQSDKPPTMDWLFEKWRAAYDRYHPDVFVLDPWNELEHVRGDGQSLTEYVGEALRDMRKWHERRDTQLLIVAHPKKLQAGEKCSLYSISDSAHWANKSDIGIVVVRDRETGRSDIQVKKVKYEELGFKPGNVELYFNPARRRYHELGEET